MEGSVKEYLAKGVGEFLEQKGISVNLDNPLVQQMSMEGLLEFLDLDREQFEAEFAHFLDPIGNALHFTVDNKAAKLIGRVPCVVQLPFQEELDRRLQSRGDYNIALAEFGFTWLDDLMKDSDPSAVIGVGIEGMVHNRYLQERGFSIHGDKPSYNADFAEFADPEGMFEWISCIPLVMVVDTSQAAGRRLPRSMADLLDPVYAESVVYPDDGHMLEGIIMTYFYEAGGREAIERFRDNVLMGAHPSQMIKPGGLDGGVKPFIMLMPWIFARIKAQQKHMQLIWPEDGAPVLPITATYRDDADGKYLREVLTGSEIGTVFRGQGFFPAACAAVDNELPGKLQFLGWEKLRSNELGEIIALCREVLATCHVMGVEEGEVCDLSMRDACAVETDAICEAPKKHSSEAGEMCRVPNGEVKEACNQ